MREREARFGEPIEIGDVTLTPLVEVSGRIEREAGGLVGGGRIQPLGVLVEGPEGTRALGLDGRELPMADGTIDRSAVEEP